MSSRLCARLRAAPVALVCGAMIASSAEAGVTIASALTQNMTCSGGICAPTAQNAVLNVADLLNLLASGNLTVTTTGNGIQANDIKVATTLLWNGQNELTLDAWRSVAIDRTVEVTGTQGLSLSTNVGGSGGSLSFGSKGNAELALSARLAINRAAFTLVESVAALASDAASNPSGNFALAGSYDASGDGTYAQAPVATIFSGYFEGLGNSISHLSIDDSNDGDAVGLFMEIYPDGKVANLNMSAVSILADDISQIAGAIAGDDQGTITNSRSSGSVKGGQFGTGGLAGVLVGTMSNSWSSASVEGADAGGLVGENDGGTIMDSHAVGAVTAVTGPNPPIGGGLVGINQGIIETSYATGSVSGSDANSELGGLLGEMDLGTLENAYATGAVSGGSTALAGGLIGAAFSGAGASYSTGTVAGGAHSFVGGYVGYDFTSGGIAHAYWDTTTSGITDLGQGAGNTSNDPGIKGRTTTQLQSALPKGFKPKVWTEDAKLNGGLPYLRANPPPK